MALGTKWRAVLQYCGKQTAHEPHSIGQTMGGAAHLLCLGTKLSQIAWAVHPAGGMIAIGPAHSTAMLEVWYVPEDDEQELLAALAEGAEAKTAPRDSEAM